MTNADGFIGAAMLLTVVSSAGLAAFVGRRARQAPEAGPLVAFLLLVALWAAGLLLPDPGGSVLMALAPLGGGAFVQVALRLSGSPQRGLPWVWAIAVAATATALFSGAGQFVPWPGGHLFRYEGTGLFAYA